MNVGLSFLRGMVASVNPCAFVLLPTYLLFFLGLEAERGGAQRASVRRALAVSAAVSTGFMAVFVAAGVLSNWVTTWLNRNAKYATAVIGAGLVVLGLAMLLGFQVPFATPRVGHRHGDRTVRGMFVYGVAYAVASIGCTIGLFTATAFSSPDSFVGGVVNVVAYGLGMALVVTSLTVTLAFANQALLRVLRSAMRHANQLAAAFVVLSGLYLLYYFWVVDVNEDTAPITDAVEGLQNDVLVALSDHWQLVALVLTGVVVAAIAYVSARRRATESRSLPSQHERAQRAHGRASDRQGAARRWGPGAQPPQHHGEHSRR